MRPRFYQKEAGDVLVDTLFNEPKEAPIVAMPTGTGKSITIAYTCKEVITRIPSANLIVATHSQELVDQDAKTLGRYWPAAPYGVYSAGLKLKQQGMPITIGNIQSMYKNPDAFGKVAGVLIDEAQAVSPAESTMYQQFFSDLRKKNKNMFVAGFTATPYRLGQGLLADGPTFSKVCYDVTGRVAFVKFIDMGYLCPVIPKPTSFQFDLTKVKMLGGDFNQKQLQEALDVDELTFKALEESLQCAHDRNHWMIFCAGIEHVESVVSMLQAWGEDAVAVHSKMHPDQRKANIQAFRDGRARMIVNDGILTTGVDFPHVDCIVLLRPTSSPGLHVQILGRGTRCDYDATGFDLNNPRQLAEWFEFLEDQANRLARIESSQKHNCLVLDFSGNVARCGPINDPRIPQKKKKGNGEVPVKICPKCDSYVHAAVRFCDGIHWDGRKCDHEFEFTSHLEQSASTETIIVREREKEPPELHWFSVDRVEYEQYNKPFTPPMMRVRYICGNRKFTEMVCIEHKSYAGIVAEKWWRKRLPKYPPPPTTHDGMTAVSLLKVPTHIEVQTNIKPYPKITKVSFIGLPMETTDGKAA